MLTRQETEATKYELQENFSRLAYPKEQVASDMGITTEQLNKVLAMDSPDPAHVWMLREYLEDKLKEHHISMLPFSKLGNRESNRWFSYETPWRNA